MQQNTFASKHARCDYIPDTTIRVAVTQLYLPTVQDERHCPRLQEKRVLNRDMTPKFDCFFSQLRCRSIIPIVWSGLLTTFTSLPCIVLAVPEKCAPCGDPLDTYRKKGQVMKIHVSLKVLLSNTYTLSLGAVF